ncbi:class I SAM-dependent methyltransferase [Micromonospora halophytica]|uniref:Methyltransferase domain-containing protein n=1 Tax=Micromonospora halophytica TaxID=47864 RepID=A0A1C5IJQ4_9ACTN|nr:class I SAM-dependent methyltransferase [Micromonospora halophytica]SCG58485.1 Methyltransferase domain-containing protein [Micromonospora halophytica]
MPEQVDTSPTRGDVLAGTAVYDQEWLSQYDNVVLDRICRRIWLCDSAEMVRLYDRNIGERHLDLGPGTGFFLDSCRQRSPRPRIALVDLNPTVLAQSAARLRRFQPAVFERDVLSPFALDGEQFDSVGMNFLLHCLPGGMRHKARVFDHARAHVVPGGRIFGSTVPGTGVPHSSEALRLLETLNEKRTFDNEGDSLRGLEAELASRFTDYEVTVRGSVALFEVRL